MGKIPLYSTSKLEKFCGNNTWQHDEQSYSYNCKNQDNKPCPYSPQTASSCKMFHVFKEEQVWQGQLCVDK